MLQLALELVQRGAQRAVVEHVADDQTHAADQLGLVRGGQHDRLAAQARRELRQGFQVGVVERMRRLGDPFDLAAIEYYLGVEATPCYCTKIASKLIRTYTDRHGLKMLVEELLGENISKAQQSSDWGGPVLNDAQREYAASDVRYLHRMKEELDRRLEREGRTEMAQACFDFLPTRARLDVAGWADHDIFSHM